MLSIDPKKIQNLRAISGSKIIGSSNLLEELSLGISHSSLGAMICKKWKFNESLIRTIEFHHRPHMAPDEKHKQLIYIVYLADIFVEIENRKFRYDIADEDVLNFFKLENKTSFDILHKVLMDAYATHSDIMAE